MSIEAIVQEIRNEIAKLNQVLHLLGGTKQTKAKQAKPRRKMSAAGRKENRGSSTGEMGEDQGCKEINNGRSSLLAVCGRSVTDRSRMRDADAFQGRGPGESRRTPAYP